MRVGWLGRPGGCPPLWGRGREGAPRAASGGGWGEGAVARGRWWGPGGVSLGVRGCRWERRFVEARGCVSAV